MKSHISTDKLGNRIEFPPPFYSVRNVSYHPAFLLPCSFWSYFLSFTLCTFLFSLFLCHQSLFKVHLLPLSLSVACVCLSLLLSLRPPLPHIIQRHIQEWLPLPLCSCFPCMSREVAVQMRSHEGKEICRPGTVIVGKSAEEWGVPLD